MPLKCEWAEGEKRAWPKELPAQVAAVRDLLAEAGALDSLAALGLAVASGAGAGRSWSVLR